MGDQQQRLRELVERARTLADSTVAPLLVELFEQLADVDPDDDPAGLRDALGVLLKRVFYAGHEAGMSEAAAQMIEQGYEGTRLVCGADDPEIVL